MNFPYSMVTWLIETHFSQKEKDKLREYLEKPQPRPDPMTERELKVQAYSNIIANRKKRKS